MRRVVNSDELLRITTLPESLAIIGAGYIGCEFASIYRTLGCEVTLIEKESRILPGWESEAGERVAQELKDRGVKIQVNNQVSFAQLEETGVGVCIAGPEGQSIEANLVLVATGRTPNSERLGLNALGIEDSSFLKVDECMRLSDTGIYAVGDVNGISMLDSTAFSQASVAINSILGREARFDRRWIPRCVHTEPPVATVGWTEEEAATNGLEYLAISDTVRLISDNERSVVDPEPIFKGDHRFAIPAFARLFGSRRSCAGGCKYCRNCDAIRLECGKLREIPLGQPSASDALMSTLRKLN